ncbi:MAG: carbohydrate binding family 9 domain-containing protein [Bacteroidetes bacterium]|nr:carbohydrate binding family 9 domain-containing protein [Bacteroidota bacterium]
MRRIVHLLILAFIFTISANAGNGKGYGNSATSEKQIRAVPTTESISIDGILSEQVWQRAGFTELYQQDPDEGEPATEKTEVWVAYDNDAIYFAAKLYDREPEKIFSRLVRRDFVWGDPSDGLVLYLDSYGDKRSGYFFYVNAAGTLADGLLENDSKQTDLSWDAVWEGVPQHNSDGWSVEIRIPYSQLRFKEGEKQVWGINVERFISRKAETDMVAYTPRNESGFASRFPDLIGIEGIKPTAGFELLPYVTGKAELLGSQVNNPITSGEKYQPGLGLDVRAGLGNSLTLNGTINPDFGQVEVDPARVNLTDVEDTFDEKRPFFTEGVSIYRFGYGGTNNSPNFSWSRPNLFYSRRIGRSPQGGLPNYDYADIPNGTHLLGAAKISGQMFDGWKVGTIHALTNREYADISLDGEQSSVEVEPLTYYGVLRAQKDFNAGAQGLGVLSTFTNRFYDDNSLREALNNNAFVAATDGWTFLDEERTYVVTGWAGISRVAGTTERINSLQKSSVHYFQRPDASHLGVDTSATSLMGYAGRIMLNKNRGRFTFNTAVGFVSPNFELNDLGYLSYSDRINAHFSANYNWNEPTEFYLRAGLNAATFANYDFGGNKTWHGYRLGGYMTLQSLAGANFSIYYNPTSYNARLTRGGPLTLNPVTRSYSLNLYSDNRMWYVLSGYGSYTKSDAAENNYMEATLEVKVTPTLTMSIGPSLSHDLIKAQWVTAFNDETATETYGKRYIFGNLDQTTFAADIRADWILTPQLSFQVYVQPLIASGRYSDFKHLARSKSFDFAKYGENGSTMEKNVSDEGDVTYLLDADGAGPSVAKNIGNPDFNFLSLRGSAVLRWEYMPGSALFLVWTQSRRDYEATGEFQFGHSMGEMFRVKPDNIFMLKFTYWLGL